jgi:transcriptional regulator with XRE-family HTH domain
MTVRGRSLGERLRRLRQRRRLTQAALATKVDIHRVYVTQIEAGTKVPSVGVLERLAKALGVAVTELLSTGRRTFSLRTSGARAPRRAGRRSR